MRLTVDRSTLAGMMLGFALLCATTMVFLFASRLLSFHGWPRLTSSSENRPLIVTSVVAAAPPVRVLTVAAPGPARASHRAAATSGSPAPVHRYAGVPGSANMTAPLTAPLPAPNTPTPNYSNDSNDSGSAHRPAPQSPAPTDKPPAHGPASDIVATVDQTARQTGSLLGNTTQGATAAVGSNVAAVTSTVGQVVGAVAPPLGQTVAGVGDAVNSTVTGVGKLLGGAAASTPATP